MKITTHNYIDVLNDLNACESQMKKLKTYSNEKIKSLIDKIYEEEVILKNMDMFYNFHWLKRKLKDKIPFKILTRTYEKDDFWEKYTYDKNGNQLSYKDNNGYSEEYIYDEHGNEYILLISQ